MPSVASELEKPRVVWLILNQRAEEALTLLAKHYKTHTPRLKVGLPKGHKKNIYGCYTSKNQTISVLSSDFLGNPFVIIHEFYHHLRSKSVDRQHKGTETNADRFAAEFLAAYQLAGGKDNR
jgi:Zn-dependent peptidase ImmA (M78 family)